MDEMEKSVANPDLGSDLRGVKDLLKKHQNLENELVVLSDQIASIVSQGQALAQSGHFDKANILKAVEDFNKRLGGCERFGRQWKLCPVEVFIQKIQKRL